MRLTETNLAHAIVEISSATQNFNLDAHEKNRQIPSIQFGKTNGVLLSRDDQFGLSLFAAIDHVENFLLRKPVMIDKSLGVDEFSANIHEALLEAPWLG